jgi:AraC-like DNA-binding protein
MYHEFKPHPSLDSFIECFWTISSNDIVDDYRLILPDGCTDIIFNFGETMSSKTGNNYSTNSMKGFVVGHMTRPMYSKSFSIYNILGIRFKPGGLYSFLQQPLDQLTDSTVDLANFHSFNHWYDELEPLTTRQRVLKLEQLLLKLIPPLTPDIVSYSLQHIIQNNGAVRIKDLSKLMGISQKQLERHYNKCVGVSPKQIARVFQFQHMLKSIKSKGEESLLQLAIDGGYSDHAHFTKAFKEFSGLSPQKFIEHHHH